MSRTSTFALLFALHAAVGLAQPAATTSVLRLTVDEAVKMALDANPDLSADRLEPEVGDTRVAASAGAFKPALNLSANQNNALLPPTSLLFPIATSNDVVTSSAGIGQQLPWFGTSYNVGWNNTHTNSNSILNSYNPLIQSGLAFSVSQPLVKNLSIDQPRQQLATNRINRDIADTTLRESIVHTTANVKSMYWGLVAAIANVEARKTALDLAQELVRVNKAKVDVGQSPPLDLVSAEAEVASNQEQLIVAETTVREVEDRLRVLIFDGSKPENWKVRLEPIDSPPAGLLALDVDAAVANALNDRTDLVRARKEIQNSDLNVKYTANQKLPDVRVNASYAASGLGGTQILRTGGFPGTVVGPGDVTSFGSVLNQLFARNYPTWAAGVSVTYPIGQSTEEANHARAKIERTQAEDRLKGSEGRAIQQVRDAAWKIDMNAKRIDTTRAARSLAEQRLDAERKRFDVGMSTSFLVIQAQRDLAQARTNELSAVLAYDLALVDFEALQQAGPSALSAAASIASAPVGDTSGGR